MRLKNILITVTDMERAVGFYKELFGLSVISYREGNVILTEGLVLQERGSFEKLIGRDVIKEHNGSELFFVEYDMEGFVRKLGDSLYPVRIVNDRITDAYGRQVIRLYDPDGNLIEVSTPAAV